MSAAGTTPGARPGSGAPPSSAKTPPAKAPRPAWVKWVVIALIAIAVAVVIVLVARWLRATPGVQDFLATYPGTAEPPAWVPEGLPAWLGWQHFLNAFVMVLLVKAGLAVRYTRRPSAFWTRTLPIPFTKRPAKRISLDLWLHLSLDVVWVANGVIYLVLIFATGHWGRIVPTSWDVIPNAVSAGLQYASLDWPTENGWFAYNGLQQLAYFVTVFIAAPLALLTGLRMSNLWPTTGALAKVPLEPARRIHFPVMLYFVLFTIVHVFLVLWTGALRNLNHIYTSRDVVDGWGVGMFAATLVLMAAAVIGLRPVILRPIAQLSGKLSR
ncbi:MAG: cytochrome b/b6 domain-containing protein [Actinomycetales bacterium]|nr:cytochrome b/b6 domain-containing protein [Actinomycetales bacterium]